jgi:threonine dehydrogenase-like Zn-dependent dehydrogenase
VGELTGGDLPTAVFDATGNPASMMDAFKYVAHGGRLVYVGLFQGDITFHDPFFHRREMTLLSSRNATAADFRRIIGLMEAGEIDTTPWITHRATLDTLIPEFPKWLEPENRVLKAILEIED